MNAQHVAACAQHNRGLCRVATVEKRAPAAHPKNSVKIGGQSLQAPHSLILRQPCFRKPTGFFASK